MSHAESDTLSPAEESLAESETVAVALVQMPFAVTAWPSLGLGLLKSALTRVGVASKVIYLNAVFADRVGEDIYQPLSTGAPHNADLLGEWVFSEALWGPSPSRDAAFLENVLRGGSATHNKTISDEQILTAWAGAQACRAEVDRYLDDCLAAHDWRGFRIVGFTSVFQQHLASLALAKRLKGAFPHLRIIFGGSNCEGPMGLATLRAFPFIDAVCIGEGDTAFPRYVQEALAGAAHARTNVVTREHLEGLSANGSEAISAPEQTVDMDALPYPDFEDFFSQCGARPAREDMPVRMIFETSRGCWWGQKNHCTFCGLNGTTMAFRYKSAQRAIDEIQYLIGRYGSHTQKLSAADNIIPYKYFDEFLPKLIDLNLNLSLFYETKANLKKEQLVAYRNAGLLEIQPGIESLDTDVLRLMRKGVSGIQNVQLLKWCKELGITALWNYLYGFPGESPSSYDVITEQMSALTHLDPPVGSGKARFDRFSPYVSTPEKFGVSDLQPYPAYRYLYPDLAPATRSDIAYYFTGQFPGREDIDAYTVRLRSAIRHWREKAPESLLAHLEDGDSTVVFDARNGEAAKVLSLKGAYHRVLSQADGIISVAQLELPEADAARLPGVLRELKERGLIFVEGDRILRLSIPLLSAYSPPPEAMARLQGLLGDQLSDGDDGERVRIDHGHVIHLDL